MTTSGLTVRNTVGWFQEEDEPGLPPIIHYLLLSNLAWLKRPASASKLKLHELVALCSAALRPSRRTWEAFQRHLRKLEQSGELSSEEVTVLIASGLTDRVLLEEEVDEDSDAATISEVVDRVKAAYMVEADAEVAAVRDEAQRMQAEADAALAIAQDEARRHLTEALQLRSRIQHRARTVASVSSWSLTITVAVGLVLGTILSMISTLGGSIPGLILLILTVLVYVFAGLFSVLWGFNLVKWRSGLEKAPHPGIWPMDYRRRLTWATQLRRAWTLGPPTAKFPSTARRGLRVQVNAHSGFTVRPPSAGARVSGQARPPPLPRVW
ncbi:MAG: hypothetical protein LC776_08330 [Acidobacteria bacterium]|nr:hypothetical protein [Acidobacteriota bacterium]